MRNPRRTHSEVTFRGQQVSDATQQALHELLNDTRLNPHTCISKGQLKHAACQLLVTNHMLAKALSEATEWVAELNKAATALVGQLPHTEFSLGSYHARDELLQLRSVLQKVRP